MIVMASVLRAKIFVPGVSLRSMRHWIFETAHRHKSRKGPTGAGLISYDGPVAVKAVERSLYLALLE
jgi:hypothetical protein